MATRFEELTLDAQLNMPRSFKNELLRRPESHRGPDSADLDGKPCTKYFRQVDPTTGRTKWSSLPGANCSVRALTPRTPRARSAPRPRTGSVPVCGSANFWLAQIAKWSTRQSGDPAFVQRYVTTWNNNMTAAFALCPGEIQRVENEIDRLIFSFGGSRTSIPIQIKVPVQLLASLNKLRASRFTPRTAAERAALAAGRKISAPDTLQTIQQTAGLTAETQPTPTTQQPIRAFVRRS